MVQTRHARLAAADAGVPPTPPQSLPKIRTKRLPKLRTVVRQAAEVADSGSSSPTSKCNASALASSQPRALLHIWLDPTAAVLASEKAPRVSPGVKVVVPLSAVNDFLKSLAQQPVPNIDNTAISPVNSRKRKTLGPANSSDSANKRAKITPLSPPAECNDTRQRTDDETTAVSQALGTDTLMSSIEGTATSGVRTAPINRLRLQRRQQPLRGSAYDFKGNLVLCPSQDEPVLVYDEANTLLTTPYQPRSMIGMLNKHRRDMQAKRAKAQREAIEAAQQQGIPTRDTSQNNDPSDAIEDAQQQGIPTENASQNSDTNDAIEPAQQQGIPSEDTSQNNDPSDAIEAAKQQGILTENASDNNDPSDAAFLTGEDWTAPGMEEATNRQPRHSSETTVQIQTQTLPSGEPSNAHHNQPSAPGSRWGLGYIVGSVSKYVPTFTRASLRTVPEGMRQSQTSSVHVETSATAESQTPSFHAQTSPIVQLDLNTKIPQTEATQVNITISPAIETTSSEEVKKSSHKSVDQRKASSKRKMSADNRYAKIMAANKLQIDNEVTRRVHEAMKAHYEAEKAAHPREKRKRYSPPVIPNPVGVSYGFDPEFFGDSDSDEAESPSDHPAKRVRLNLDATTHVFPSDEIIGDRYRAQPYTGMTVNPSRGILKGNYPIGTFPDNDDNSEAWAPELDSRYKPRPLKDYYLPPLSMSFVASKEVTKTMPAKERNALIAAEYAKEYAARKAECGNRMGPKELALRTDIRVQHWARKKLPPAEPEPEDQAEPESLARARQKATKYTPNRPSPLRSVSRTSTSPIGTPSDAGNIVKVHEPIENLAKKPASPTNGNATQPLRGLLRPSKGNAMGEFSQNVVPTNVNEGQISANGSQVSKANETPLSNRNNSQPMAKQVELQLEQPRVQSSVAATVHAITSTDLADFQFSYFESDDYWDPIVKQQLEKNWTSADTDRAVQVGAKDLAQYLAKQSSSATN